MSTTHIILSTSLFHPGQRVRYVPVVAGKRHPEALGCADGTVTRCNDERVFVRYDGDTAAKATKPRDLVKLDTVVATH